ncbi:MAG: hypothetical protein ACYTG6_15165, partial [Planctomycetota bacterium]
YRYNSGRFDRQVPGRTLLEDGGHWHHFGAKLTWERSFTSTSPWYFWFGFGGEYFVTQDYVNDDEGFGIFGEIGLGYVVNQNIRVRLGLNAHGVDTDVTRLNPVNDGQSRWLWIWAPVLELEVDF